MNKAMDGFDQAEGFHHLEKLEALYRRQQRALKFAGRRCPEVQKTLLDPYRKLLEMQCKMIVQGDERNVLCSKGYQRMGSYRVSVHSKPVTHYAEAQCGFSLDQWLA
jgi:hypothetical protein